MNTARRATRTWERQAAALRDPAEIVARHEPAVPPGSVAPRVRGAFWDVLAATRSMLLVSREYEHVLLSLSVIGGRPSVRWMALPHPSGITFDEASGRVHVACTRNPNEILTLSAVTPENDSSRQVLFPERTTLFPGRCYIHDLAMIKGRLHANAVGLNAVVAVGISDVQPVWWPRCMDADGQPRAERNYIQLNSIAAGTTLRSSFFTASSARISARRPGHRHYPVDRRGVVFSGASREVVATGLTRPHSARLHDGRLWVDNSGYGELGWIEDGGFRALARLPGWTRGLALAQTVAFVGTSRVLPRFAAYAPGLDPRSCYCGVHAVDVRSGRTLGTVSWPGGNQIFALQLVPLHVAVGLPFETRAGRAARHKLAYAFTRTPEDAR